MENIFKKITAFLLAILIAIALSACNNEITNDNSNSIINSSSESSDETSASSDEIENAVVSTETESSEVIENSDSEELSDTECLHTWGEWSEKTAPSCEKEGLKIRTCTVCSLEETIVLDKTNHIESDWIIDKNAEEGKSGSKHTECITCKTQLKVEVIAALPEKHTHKGVKWDTVKQPDCTVDGSRNYVCECGFVVKTEAIKAVGHKAVTDKSVEANCTSSGLTEGKHCSVCGTVLVAQKTVAAKGHKMSSEIVPPTPEDQGYTKHSCTICSYSYNDSFTLYEKPTPEPQFTFISRGNGTCAITGFADASHEHVVIPSESPDGETVVEICDRAFLRNNVIKSVSIPSTVKKIGEFAFGECENLSEFVGGQFLTQIDGHAFQKCAALTQIDISGATLLGNGIFGDCRSLTSAKLSADLKKLPQNTFWGCGRLNITLPDGITVIGNGAFGNSDIESIVLASSVKEIEMYAFRYCDNLKSITLPDGLEIIGACAFENCEALKSIDLPDSLNSLGRLAFLSCKSLEAIVLPDGLTHLGDSCFAYCTSLTYAKLPSTLESITERTFMECSALKNVTLPSGIKGIGHEAFANTAIEIIEIPDSCVQIGRDAFRGCSNLVTVTFGKSLKSIAGSAFSRCSSLKSVVLPDGIESIGDWAFIGCAKLQELYLGSSITDIGSGAFRDCMALSSVFLPKSLSGITKYDYDESPFIGCSGALALYSDLEKGNHSVWEKYFGRVSYGVSYDEYLAAIEQ